MSEELKACPWCKAGAFDCDEQFQFHHVLCHECGARGPEKESEAEAKKAWHTRAESAEIARLRAERDALFLQLGGLQSCIAEELDLDRTPLDADEVRPILRRLAERVKGFAKELAALMNSAEHYQVDLEALCGLTEKHGIVELVTYDQEQHGYVEAAEAGAAIYHPAAALTEGASE